MIDQFWKSFLEATKKDVSTTYYESFRFEVGEKLSNQLLQLVLSGKKKATSSSLLSYEVSGEEIPKVGDYSIITDWNHVPQCVIETTAVTILPFKEITWEMCRREGEDENLESWQKGHREVFKNEGKLIGYEFSEDMLVVFEDFKTVYFLIDTLKLY